MLNRIPSKKKSGTASKERRIHAMHRKFARLRTTNQMVAEVKIK
jgi:hypothetical protein